MAGSPKWKAYKANGEYEASCKDVVVAGVIVAWLGDGATIRYNHKFIVFTEGKEQESAANYDYCEKLCYDRLKERKSKL